MGDLRRATQRAVRGARAAVGHRPVTRASESVRVHLTVEPELVDDIADLLTRVEGHAVRRNGSVVTVPFAPNRDPAQAAKELRRVLNWWGDRHPGISVEVSPCTEDERDLAEAAGVAAGRGVLAVSALAQGLGSGHVFKRSARRIGRAAFRLRRRTTPPASSA